MPFAELAGARVHYELEGPSSDPVILFSNSLGTNLTMWEPQINAVQKRMRVLRYDTRGHGRTQATSGPYSIEQLGQDVLGLLDHLSVQRIHFCGLSMGGVIGMWLGLHAAERLEKLMLCSTAAKIGSVETWNGRIDAVRKGGVRAVASSVIERWFTPSFRAQEPSKVAGTQEMLEQTNAEGYIACCAALRDSDLRATISSIRAPTLVMSATHDPVTPPADGHFLAEQISGAHYSEVRAAHLSNIEVAERFNSEICAFLGI